MGISRVGEVIAIFFIYSNAAVIVITDFWGDTAAALYSNNHSLLAEPKWFKDTQCTH